MKKIAKFSKVSLEQYLIDMEKNTEFNKETIIEIYKMINLPERATMGSAGYDFKVPFRITLKPKETKKIPTGIRVEMAEGWVLFIVPRSSLGFKYRMQLDNTIGVIDSDYYYSDNEGHIMLKVTNDTNEEKELTIESNKGICQGIFIEYGITIDDNTMDKRNGGFGSTN